MKRLIALLLAAALSFSLVACGGNENDAVDEENAIEATPTDVYNDVKENEARALQNTYKVTGEIDSIAADSCKIDNLIIYLDNDTLINLNKGDTITFIGNISNTKEESVSMGGGTHTTLYIEFSNASLIEE